MKFCEELLRSRGINNLVTSLRFGLDYKLPATSNNELVTSVSNSSVSSVCNSKKGKQEINKRCEKKRKHAKQSTRQGFKN